MSASSFSDRAGTYFRIIDALILREISGRFGTSRLGYLWAILTPLLSISVLFFVFGTLRGRETEMPLLGFLITGWFTFEFYTGTFSTVGNGEAANRSLVMHPNVSRLDVFTARAVLQTLTTVVFFAIGMLISMSVEGTPLPSNLGLVTASFFAAGLMGAAGGLVIAATATYFTVAMNFVTPLNRVLFFLSGVLFTASMLPSWTLEYLRWNPLIHPVEGMRQGWYAAYQSPILDLSYTYSVALPLLALGLYLERRTRRGIKLG